jgi:hypothetical protein
MENLLIYVLHLVYGSSEKEGVEYRQSICEIVIQSKDPVLNWSAVLNDSEKLTVDKRFDSADSWKNIVTCTRLPDFNFPVLPLLPGTDL